MDDAEMGDIVKKLEIQGDKGKADGTVLFDTGASRSLVRRDFVAKIATLHRSPYPYTFRLGDGKGRLKVDEFVALFIKLKGVTIFHQFLVAKNLAEEMVLGSDAMQLWKIELVPEKEDVRVRKELIDLKLV